MFYLISTITFFFLGGIIYLTFKDFWEELITKKMEVNTIHNELVGVD